MKTKEQVQAHLMMVGYSDTAVYKIMGFLIGKELKDCEEKFVVKKGNNCFNDFLVWFSLDKDEMVDINDLEYGDYVHLSSGQNLIVITLMEDSKDFVGFDGENIGCYVWDSGSRLCTDEELAVVMDRMHNNGLDFDYVSCSIVPLSANVKDE